MKADGWQYLISMASLGCSIAVMIWASGVPNSTVTVLALLSAAYWGLCAFGAAGELHESSGPVAEALRQMSFTLDDHTTTVGLHPEDHVG